MVLTMGCRLAGVNSRAVNRDRPQNCVLTETNMLACCRLNRHGTHV